MILFAGQSMASEEYEIVSPIRVYRNPERAGRPVAQLEEGEFVEVELGEATPDGWRSIRIKDDENSYQGFVLSREWRKKARLQMAIEKKEPAVPKALAQRLSRLRFGLSGGYSYFFQPSHILYSEASGNVKVSDLTGTSTVVAFSVEYQLPVDWTLRGRLLWRAIEQRGSAELQTSGGISTTPSEVLVQQQFVGGAVGFIRYLSENLWFDFGMELDRGVKVEVSYGSLGTGETELIPIFAIVQTAIGYDIHFSSGWSLVPSLQLGMVVNANPVAYLFDLSFNFGI